MDHIWRNIKDFPNYEVSHTGLVRNAVSGHVLSQSVTGNGVVKVGLVCNGIQTSKSVKVLVARAFVQGETEVFDTPIQLDGYPEHCEASNLMWRPRWFAWKYARQFASVSPHHDVGPLREVESGERFLDVYEAATLNGLLFIDVWKSIHTRQAAFPTWQAFEIIR